VSTVAQTDEGHQQAVEIGLEISNASKIDKLAEILSAMQKAMTLLAQKTVLTGVAVKTERIKKEPGNYETIVVDSGSSNDEGSSNSNALKRKLFSRKCS
jgi:hypothetical protein